MEYASELSGNAIALVLHRPEITEGDDVSDWLDIGGEHTAEQLKALIEGAPDYADDAETPASQAAAAPDDNAELERLANLPVLQYEREREAAAEKLNGTNPNCQRGEVPKRNPHERRPRAPDWQPGAAAEIAELAAERDDATGADIAA